MIENHKKMQKQTLVNHSRIATKFIFNDFNTETINHKNFHRYDMDPIFRKVKFKIRKHKRKFKFQ